MKLRACLLILLSTATSIAAQQASPSQPVPTFKSRTELVTVPVVVLKRQNPFRQLLWAGTPDEHVTGLTKDAFEIKEDGERKSIASFEEVRSSNAGVTPVVPLPGSYTNQVTADGPVTMVVILLDLAHTPMFYRDYAKQKLLDYLQNDFHADCPTMLAVVDPDKGLRILHDFTTDPQVLATIARQLKNNSKHEASLDYQTGLSINAIGDQPDFKREYDDIRTALIGTDSAIQGVGYLQTALGQQYYAHRQDQNDFGYIQAFASMLAAVRGMKSLVWITGEIALPDPTRSIDLSHDIRQYAQYEKSLKLFSSAGMAVFPVDAVPETTNPAWISPQFTGPPTVRPNSAMFDSPTLQWDTQMSGIQNFMDIAQKTGGDYCLLRKDPDLCIRKAVDYNSHYYLLTYYTHSAEKASWRKIHVKVKGEGLSVRARNGYFSSGASRDPEQRRKLDMVQASSTPVEYRGLPVSVRWKSSSEAPTTKILANSKSPSDPHLRDRQMRPFVIGIGADQLTVDAADRNHVKLDLLVVALDSNGHFLADRTQQIELYPNANHLEQMRKKGFAYSSTVEVPSRTAKVRFIVRDDLSERIGTVSVPIEAQQ